MGAQSKDINETIERSACGLSRGWRLLEAYSLAVAGGCLLAYFEQYLPPLLVPALLLIGALGAAATWKLFDLDLEENFDLYPGAVTAFFAVQVLWLPVSQPLYGYLAPVLFSLGASLLAVRLFAKRSGREVGLSFYLLSIPLAAALTYPTELAYGWAFEVAIPAIQPARIALYTVSPFILVVAFTAITWFCAWRIRELDERLIYNYLPALTAFVFAALFPMYEADGTGWWALLTWGNAAEWAFALTVLVLSFSYNTKRLVWFTTTVAVTFCGLFAVFTTVPSLHQLMIAESLNVRTPEHLPVSTENPRIMPYVIGERRCKEGTSESATRTGAVSFTMESNGINYQCALHFDGFVAGEGVTRGVISMIPGASYRIVRVESTNTSGEITPMDAVFPFGEGTSTLQSTILARHPGGQLGEFTYSEEDGKLRLVYSYTSPRLFWFTMVPSVGGAVVENKMGLLQDYTVSHAAEHFGGAFQVPAQLVRDRAEAWAHYRLAAWWPFRQEKELSEPGDTLAGLPADKRGLFGNNKLPFAIPTVDGPKYWLLLEPAGKNGTAGSDILLFDARFPGLIEREDTTEGRVVKGLRDVVNQAPAVVPGNFNLRGSEVYLHITQKDKYFIVPLLDTNGKFIGAAILRSDEYIVFAGAVVTSQEVVEHIREFEKTH